MNVRFYKNNSNNNVVDKQLEEGFGADVILLEAESKMNIHIRLAHTGDFVYNYVYIPEFSRYYYITEIVHSTNDLVDITCRTDVLMSFRDDIRNINGTVARNQNLANAYINDDRYIGKAYKKIVTKKFPNAIENDTIYLRTLGRGV